MADSASVGLGGDHLIWPLNFGLKESSNLDPPSTLIHMLEDDVPIDHGRFWGSMISLRGVPWNALIAKCFTVL